MTETSRNVSSEVAVNVRIVGLNTDKTRKMIGSDTLYQVYFELSDSPPVVWRYVFEQEWNALHAGQPVSLQETNIDRAFLVLHCPLQDVPLHLPVLKKAIATTNKTYAQDVQKHSTEQKNREDTWKDERKTVEDIVKSLHFD